MKNTRTKIITTALLSLAFVSLGVGTANATPAPPPGYVTVAYEMPGWIDSRTPTWPQKVYAFHEDANLHGFDSVLAALQVECGTSRQFQIDVNYDSEVIRSTIAGGVLNGPNDPGESLIPGGWDVAYKLIKVDGPVCAEKPQPRPYSDQGSSFTCELVTDWVKEGFFDSTFDPVANVWTENSEPTLTLDESTTREPTEDEKHARGCLPEATPTPVPDSTPPPAPEAELAQTGLTDDPFQFAAILFAGLILLAGGIAVVVIKSRRTA